MSEEVDEEESDDAGGAGRGAAGDNVAAGQRRRGAVSDGVGLACNHFTAADDDSYQIADT